MHEKAGTVYQVLQNGFGWRTLIINVPNAEHVTAVDIEDDGSSILPGDDVNWDWTTMYWKSSKSPYYHPIPRRIIKLVEEV